MQRWFFVLLEYFAVIGAIANVAYVNWQLGMQSVNLVNANTIFMPTLWCLLGVIAHLAGAVVFKMGVQQRDKDGQWIPRSTVTTIFRAITRPKKWPTTPKMYLSFKTAVQVEFEMRSEGSEERLQYGITPESRCFTLLAWFLSVFIIFHIILGTYILASTNFFGPKDALGVLARYVLSVIICRIVVVYELAVERVDATFEAAPMSEGNHHM